MKKNWARAAAIGLMTVVFLFFFLRSVQWNQVFSYLKDVNIPLFILLVPLGSMHLVTRALRWRYLLIHEKKGVKFYNMFAGNAVGFTVNFIFPGRIGELIKPLYLAQKEGIRKGYAVGTVVVERIFDMLTMCFLLGVFLLAKPLYASFFNANEEAYRSLYFWGKIGGIFAIGLLLIVLSLYFFRSRTLKAVSFMLKPFPARVTRKVLALSDEFIEGLKFFHSWRTALVYAGMSLVVWLAIMFFYWIMLFAYHIHIPFFLLIPYVFLTGVGASIPTPGMVGGYDYFSKLGLTSLYAIDANLAVGMTLVVHAIQVVVTCIIGYVILGKEGLSLLQIKKMGESVKA
ncbi:MAG: lysylphosphatidylglycerol synthase transmembrane domain-containing protein [Acidobacteriota bacterium]|nr:lysylphosphatidylglycerol synthase transmembrane domain-containing protein [Acidobacteriota bacterium]